MTRGESIFRQEWILEDEKIRKGLTITSHPALMSYVTKLFVEEGKDVYLCEEVGIEVVLSKNDKHKFGHISTLFDISISS